jgi:acylglycerol lipase
MADPWIDTLRHTDGYSAAVRWLLPERPRGAVLYLHGIQSHGGWYEASARRLAERGLCVLMPDRRGSGLNRAQRGHAESAERLLADGEDYLTAIRERVGIGAAHIVGVSWGGKWAAALAVRQPEAVASLTLVAPGLFAAVDLPTREKVRVAWSLVADPRRPFPIPLNDARLFTHDEGWRAFVERDELRLREVTATFLLASRRLDRAASRLADGGWRGPLHLLLAGDDRIIDNQRTRAFVRALPLADRRITEYAGAAHTLEFQREPTAFHEDLAGWIAERMGESSGRPAGNETG